MAESFTGNRVIEIATLPNPGLSPLDILQCLHKENKESFLLESTRKDPKQGRYSFVGTNPFLRFKAKGNNVTIYSKTPSGEKKKETTTKPPLDLLRKLLQNHRLKYPTNLKDVPPFLGGAVGYFGYETVHYLERLPPHKVDDLKLPDIYFMFAENSVVVDHNTNTLTLTSCTPSAKESKKAIAAMKKKIAQYIPIPPKQNSSKTPAVFSSNFTKEAYLAAVQKVKNYVHQGDTFQVNLSQRFSTSTPKSPLEIYAKLSSINPAPFAGLLLLDGFAIISSSPERLVRLENGTASTRPMGGTRKRGNTQKQDAALEQELKTNQKELAEHTMLVDLERNDLGRACAFGTVQVDEIMTIERYSHVMHLVSNIIGKLPPHKDCLDLFNGMFPGGTITGCPKVRTMEIIAELEPTARGPYTGSMGYISFHGDMDLNILIRTIVLKDGMAYLQTGGGIVADSEPKAEYQETLNKAAALMEALQ
ncbi:anthranilate synthase component I family protein [Candidatus Woesearchaeota archaeon]|nr:anthranilate synthase component I family protein [Candidatus Woesearchaeota archaeon]